MANGRWLSKKTPTSNIMLLKTVNWRPECLSLPTCTVAICPNVHMISDLGLCHAYWVLWACTVLPGGWSLLEPTGGKWCMNTLGRPLSGSWFFVFVSFFCKLTEASLEHCQLPWEPCSFPFFQPSQHDISFSTAPHQAQLTLQNQGVEWRENNVPIRCGALRLSPVSE